MHAFYKPTLLSLYYLGVLVRFCVRADVESDANHEVRVLEDAAS